MSCIGNSTDKVLVECFSVTLKRKSFTMTRRFLAIQHIGGRCFAGEFDTILFEFTHGATMVHRWFPSGEFLSLFNLLFN